MRILIVEDNVFNAFCLCRLLESVLRSVSITTVTNSQAALAYFHNHLPDIVIIDGHLKPSHELHRSGPELANFLLHRYPLLPIIAWTDSESMRQQFAQVFNQHNKLLNEYNLWNKVTGIERISKTWAYYFGGLIISENIMPHYYPTRMAHC